MEPINSSFRSRFHSLSLGMVALFLVISIILFPEQAFQSSLKGLKVWWDVVFPALLPFFIASEIMMGFGVVHFLGVLLEPLMRPLFRVPGAGAFVMAMGLASGYPIGAKLTARLREQELITRTEGERLVSFTNTADPLFMFGAVAVGFFHDATLGIIIAIAHYISSLIVAFMMRFHEPHGPATPPPEPDPTFVLFRAFREMHHARLKDGRNFGQLMGEAIHSSIQTLLLIGGFLIMFSVLIEVLKQAGITELFSSVIGGLLTLVQFPSELSGSIIAGVFEITLGAQAASQLPNSIHMAYKIAIVGAVTAWSGFSVHAQVASILSKTDIRYTPYCLARILHGIIACWITLLLWNPVGDYIQSNSTSVPAFFQEYPVTGWDSIAKQISFFGWKMVSIVLILVLLSIFIRFIHQIRTKQF
ncbi:sporulation integral membrane protein YlbJ [Melghirimyces algeriensis]|uniref:Sporulation integral membrane protein YlbJ n=1 Tax=Melghirimyces algeriensis TaxID=910412 RepID=A0A521BHE0_9BACL|nr:sporulation integral membrane protein YlbJ [Melghirimyces algeriensis]SMO46554.1 sporulation integral membrane protein YlbJ [Melghirimyces algeriensis]